MERSSHQADVWTKVANEFISFRADVKPRITANRVYVADQQADRTKRKAIMPIVNANIRSPKHMQSAIAVILCAAFITSGRAVFDRNANAQPAATQTQTQTQESARLGKRLMAAYPGIVVHVTGTRLFFSDGSTMPLDDGTREKSFARWLAAPDIEDMFALPYPWHASIAAPAKNFDPGRARNAAFFNKVYGDCTKGDVEKNLVTIDWLPGKAKRRIRVSRTNGVADAFNAVSRELDLLPPRFDKYLHAFGGTYNCRRIAGTRRTSAHGYGIAIDIAPQLASYWRWTRPGQGGTYAFRNKIPAEIVDIFEKHGFIWGGRWYHFDTMHFEYRPELRPLPPAKP